MVMITARERLDLRRMLHEALVLPERRAGADRRMCLAYPRGGRRDADALRLTEYRRRLAAADPFRWPRQVAGWAWTMGGSLLLAGGVVALIWGLA